MKKWIFFFLCLMALPAEAEIYHAGGKCKPLKAVPEEDVNLVPGQDLHGQPVVPADIEPPPVDMEALKNPPIGLRLPIDAYIKPDAYNADLSGTEIRSGTITQGQEGQILLNGKPLSTGQQAVYPEECR